MPKCPSLDDIGSFFQKCCKDLKESICGSQPEQSDVDNNAVETRRKQSADHPATLKESPYLVGQPGDSPSPSFTSVEHSNDGPPISTDLEAAVESEPELKLGRGPRTNPLAPVTFAYDFYLANTPPSPRTHRPSHPPQYQFEELPGVTVATSAGTNSPTC